jgi:hypothetical protein
MDLAPVPVQTPFIAEMRVFTAWHLADIRFAIFCFVFPKNCESKYLYVLKENGHTVRQTP